MADNPQEFDWLLMDSTNKKDLSTFPQPWRVVWLLAIGSFAVGTGLFALSGVLPLMAASLHVPVAVAGQSVTVFAVTYAVVAPILASFASRWPTRSFLLIALGIFTVGNALSAFATSLELLMVTRIIAAIGAAAFSPVALGAAAAIVPEAKRGQALAIVMSGLNAALAVGVPLGVALAGVSSWQSAVLVVTALGVVAIAVIAIGVPKLPQGQQTSIKRMLGIMRFAPVTRVLVVTTLLIAAGISAYAYVAPLVQSTVGATGTVFIVLLVVYGVGAFAGSLGSGVLTDRIGSRRALTGTVSMLVVVLLLLPNVHVLWGCMILLFLWGGLFVANTTPQQHRLVSLVPHEPTVVVSLNSSAIYVGQAIGAACGGALLAVGVDSSKLPYLAAGLALCALILHVVSTRPIPCPESAQASNSSSQAVTE
ncbi:MFS transporter [Paenarthrobacter sp. 2TAF44]|uniref:MFS transporter n=1 Tax=Paenarthrobacter sp. 2TAF44 TaxID=3233018 RepID=UPI003F9CE46A